MTEISHIANTTEMQDADGPTLAAQLQSLLGAALGGNHDPEQATRIMLEALQDRAALPVAQRRVVELEAALAAETARIPVLEAEANKTRGFFSFVGSAHKEAKAAGRSSGESDNPDVLIGFAIAATESHKQLQDFITRFNGQAKELAELKAEHSEFEPIMAMISASLGRAGSYEEMHNVTQEALEARAHRHATEARLAEIEHANSLRELEALFAKAKAEHKLTPFIETQMRLAFAAGSLTLPHAEFTLSCLVTIPGLEHKAVCSPFDALAGTKWNGKAWGEMQPAERAALAKEDPEIYRAMRAAATAAGKVY